MRHKHRVLLAIIFSAATSSLSYAQVGLRTGYFSDGYISRAIQNPSFTPERSFIGLGNTFIGIKTKMRLTDFIHIDNNGNWNDFSENNFPLESFLQNIKKRNTANVEYSKPLLLFGFWHKNRFFSSFDLSLRQVSTIELPYDFFRILKENTIKEESKYDLGRTRLEARLYMQLSYGLSIPIGTRIRAGARMKLLGGLAALNVNIPNLLIDYKSNTLTLKGEGNLSLSSGFIYDLQIPAENERIDISALKGKPGFPQLSGFGGGMDLGINYNIFDWMDLSASIQDLGFMVWKNQLKAVMQNEVTYKIKKDDNPGEENNQNVSLENFLAFTNDNSNWGNWGETLPPSLMAGVEARLPSYKKLSAGLLYTGRLTWHLPWQELRLSFNFAPVNWLDLSTSYAVSSFGGSLGWAISARLGSVALFLGAESSIYGFKNTLPLGKMNLDISTGLNILFGKRHERTAAGNIENASRF